MQNISKLFDNNDIKNTHKMYKHVFYKIKPYLISKFKDIVKNRHISNRGRPAKFNYDKFFEAMFFIIDNSVKMSYIKNIFNIPTSTFYFYFNIIIKSSFFEIIHKELCNTSKPLTESDYVMTDTFTVKSMDGSIGVGRNPTDRGRMGIKVSIICDNHLITRAIYLAPANVHDSKLLLPTINSSVSNIKNIKCLADSGYAGHKYIENINRLTHINLISKPKRNANKNKKTHVLTSFDSELLDSKRNGIERLNGNIRRFRGLMVKYTKTIKSYQTYLYLAIICINCYHMYVNSN